MFVTLRQIHVNSCLFVCFHEHVPVAVLSSLPFSTFYANWFSCLRFIVTPCFPTRLLLIDTCTWLSVILSGVCETCCFDYAVTIISFACCTRTWSGVETRAQDWKMEIGVRYFTISNHVLNPSNLISSPHCWACSWYKAAGACTLVVLISLAWFLITNKANCTSSCIILNYKMKE
jgi:hypothetical protein